MRFVFWLQETPTGVPPPTPPVMTSTPYPGRVVIDVKELQVEKVVRVVRVY